MLRTKVLTAFSSSCRGKARPLISLDLDLVRRLRIPYDWALEIGTLAEVFRNAAPRAICQSELCENYDHKHQELSVRDPDKGLNKMAVDLARSFFRQMAAEGIKLDAGLIQVVYGGRPAVSRQRCYWKVRVWDKDGQPAESAPAYWETGLLAPADWKASWIDHRPQRGRHPRGPGPHQR